MNLFKITNGTNNWEVQIKNKKYVVCHTNEYYPMYLSMKQFCSKEKSEYRDENNLKVRIFLDDNELNLKNNLFLEISDTYSLNDDKKLAAKSLILKYLELKLQHQEFYETINTINLLLNSLSDEMNDESILKVQFYSAGYKQLIKLLMPYYENEFQKDEFDLTMNELISFQIQLIRYIITNNTRYDNIIIYSKLNCLNTNIIKELDSLTNCKVIIFTNNYHDDMRLEDIYLLEKNLIDFANIELFYQMFVNNSYQYYTIEEVQKMVIQYLKQNYTHKINDIYQELKHFFNR